MYEFKSRPLISNVFYHFLKLVFRYYCPVTCHHLERIPNESVIFCANHTSHIDGAVLYQQLLGPNRPIALIAAADYFFSQNYHALAQYLLPLIPIDRDASADTVGEFMDNTQAFISANNASLVMFPEGTRSYEDVLMPFKPGAALISLVLGLTIIPVYIQGAKDALPKGRFIPRHYPIDVYFGEAIRPTERFDFKHLHQNPAICQKLINQVQHKIRGLALNDAKIDLKITT